MAVLIPVGLVGSHKTPGAFSEVRYAQGAGSIGDNPRYCRLQGYKLPSAPAADNEIFDVADLDEAISRVGIGSQLARQIAAAFAVPGVLLRVTASVEPSGGTQATLTAAIGGSWSTAGDFNLLVGDEVVNIEVGATENATAVGGRIEERVNAIVNGFCTGVNAAGTVTLTVRNKGAHGNDYVCFADTTRAPAGLTVTLTGGSVLANGFTPFSGGAGNATINDVLDATEDDHADYSAWGANDATSAAAIVTQLQTKAGPFGVGTEFAVFGHSGTQSAAGSFVTSNLNQALVQLVWFQGSRNHPSEVAAAMAAYRSVAESTPVTSLGDPNHRYDFEALPGIVPHYKQEHSPSLTVTNAALNTGLTPIVTRNGSAVVLRSITSRCRNGSLPDYRVLDTGDAVVPQRVREAVDNMWVTSHAVDNVAVGPDLPNDEPPPEGLSTPTLLATEINGLLVGYESENLLQDVANNQAVVSYNSTLKALIANVPTKVRSQNHLVGVVVRQIPG